MRRIIVSLLMMFAVTGCLLDGPTGLQGPEGKQGEPGPAAEPGAEGEPGYGAFCGQHNKTKGDLGGYEGAKTMCEAACNDADAHMCTGVEMVMSAQLGLLPANSSFWYANNSVSSVNISGQTYLNNDCFGWTEDGSGTATAVGSLFSDMPNAVFCAGVFGALPDLACCS